jgi:hypothetical protein
MDMIIDNAEKEQFGPRDVGKLPHCGSQGCLIREQRVAATGAVGQVPALHCFSFMRRTSLDGPRETAKYLKENEKTMPRENGNPRE